MGYQMLLSKTIQLLYFPFPTVQFSRNDLPWFVACEAGMAELLAHTHCYVSQHCLLVDTEIGMQETENWKVDSQSPHCMPSRLKSSSSDVDAQQARMEPYLRGC